jgi:hypothetical protein
LSCELEPVVIDGDVPGRVVPVEPATPGTLPPLPLIPTPPPAAPPAPDDWAKATGAVAARITAAVKIEIDRRVIGFSII